MAANAGAQSVGAIEVLSNRATALTVTNSAATNGTLTFNGQTVGTNNNVILRNASGQSLTLADGGGGALGVALGNTNTNVVLVDGAGGITIGSSISGSGQLTKAGNGTLTLSGNNTYSGGTLVSQGILQIGNGGTSGSLAGSITNNAGLVFNRSDDLTQSNAISGSGSVVKTGAGTLTLSGNNTYSGGTTLSSGVLRAAHAGALGTGVLQASSGTTLEVTNGITVSNNLSVYTVKFLNGGNTLSGTITNNNTVYDVASGTTSTLSGFLTGSGGVELTGGGVLAITGTTNNYSGHTVVSNGTLRIGTLVGRWQFGEGSGSNTVNSVNGVNAVMEGGATFGTLTNLPFGPSGTVALGTNRYVDTMQAAAQVLPTTGSYSISAWGYITNGASESWTLVSAATDTTGNSIIEGNASLGEARGTVFGPGYSPFSPTPWVGDIATNAWNNYVLVNDAASQSITLYVNGVASLTTNYTGAPFSDPTGAWVFGGKSFFQGEMADVQFYTGALSQTQISNVIMDGNAIASLANSNTTGALGLNNNITLAGTNATNAILEYIGGKATTDRAFVLTNGGGTIKMSAASTEMTLTGSASGTGKLIVGEGTLVLSNTGASNSFAPGSIQVDSGATLQLAANNQIGDSSGLILNGGTFRVGTSTSQFSETLGTLTLSASSTIDLGSWTGGTTPRQITFANSSAIVWTGTLTITNWQGVARQSSDVAEILFGAGGLTSTQLGQIYFANQGISGATLLGSGELAPIPEARVAWAALALSLFVIWRERHRFVARIRRRWPSRVR
jgi:autotransporter-associated beta strand protein